jgi:hypothetical protein
MRPEIFSEVRKLRNEIAHGVHGAGWTPLLERFSALGLQIPTSELPDLAPIIFAYGGHLGTRWVPALLVRILAELLRGQHVGIVCDPWAGAGELLANVGQITNASKALAFTPSQAEFSLGKVLAGEAEWHHGDPLLQLQSLKSELDLVASILPFGLKSDHSITLTRPDGTSVELRGDLGSLILASAAARLSREGIGLFVMPPSLFLSRTSVVREFRGLGLNLEAALALPAGSFAPYTNIPTYLVAVRKQAASPMFVAQLSSDMNTNAQIIANLKVRKEGGRLELGRLVDPIAFRGLDSIRLSEQFDQFGTQFGSPAVRLEELSTLITLGRSDSNFEFPTHSNAIYIPLIGSNNVVESVKDLTLKRHNYAQVAIDPSRSNSRFVARFLNSEFGKEIRERNKTAGVIPKLNKQCVKNIRIFVPSPHAQKAMLDTEVRIAAEQNTLLGLQNELGALQREVWTNPRAVVRVNQRLGGLSSRLSGGLKAYAEEGLEQWFESLPFPLASICRAWQATPGNDFKTKYEHLLHFFEATAEFVGVILLSAFTSNEALFAQHREKIAESLKKHNLSIQRSTFGTWKLVVEYLGKRTRELLAADKDTKDICAELFADQSLLLPEAIGRSELAAILSTTNKMRNDWGGHGGIVGPEEAKLRNEQLVGEIQKVREVFAETWNQTRLIHALQCRPLRGVFDNEVAVLKGSNSEFLKETLQMGTWLDVERLYLYNPHSSQALKLLPLVQVGPTPQSVKNACYFYNRLEHDGSARFISYHFTDEPERIEKSDDAAEAIKLLTEV